jgi:hypothetical protein
VHLDNRGLRGRKPADVKNGQALITVLSGLRGLAGSLWLAKKPTTGRDALTRHIPHFTLALSTRTASQV